MAAEKHPVSLLQEHMVQQHKRMPMYDITPSYAGFTCKLTVDDIITTATAASKQIAKFQAATKAVAILKEKASNFTRKTSTPVPDNSACCSLESSIDPNISSFQLEVCDDNVDTSANNSDVEHLSWYAPTNAAVFKHPISELQEMLVKQKKPLPIYNITDNSKFNFPNFQCTLVIDGMPFVAEGPSKQVVRKEVAEKALKHVKHCLISDKAIAPISHPNAEAAYNPIGMLNEYLQQNAYTVANYQEMGMSNASEFIITCTAAGKTTEGRSLNKKSAKREAADCMVKLLNITKLTPAVTASPLKIVADEELRERLNCQAKSFTIPANNPDNKDMIKKEYGYTKESVIESQTESVPELESTIQKDLVDDEEVIRKYGECMKDEIQCIIDKQETLTLSDTTEEVDIPQTKLELMRHLKKMSIPFKCGVLQEEPLIMYLAFQDSSKTTVLGVGETYEEANIEVLKEAYKMKMSGNMKQ